MDVYNDHIIKTMYHTIASAYLDSGGMTDLLIVLFYTALLVIITSVISLKTNDPDPMLAGRNMPWWLIGASITGTSISSMAFLGFTDCGYDLQVVQLAVYLIGGTIGTIVSVFCFVSFLRKSPNASIYTLLGQRFGQWASIYAAIIFILFTTIRCGAITLIVAQGIHTICGIDMVSVMILSGALVIFYTYMSGIEGVIWTDLFQTIFLGLAGLCVLNFLIDQTPYSFIEGASIIKQNSIGNHFWDDVKNDWSLLWVPLAFFTFNSITFYGSCQGTAQRYLVGRSDGHAKGGVLSGGFLSVVCITLFYVLGMILYLYHYNLTQISPDCVMPVAKGAFANFLAESCPHGLKGIAIVGILAAAMSTIDTSINSSATVLICNLYEPFIKSPSDRQSLLTMQILRASSAVFGVAGILMAYLAHINSLGALRFMWIGMGFVNFGLVGLILILRFNKSIGHKGAITGLCFGTVMAFWAMFTSGTDLSWRCPWDQMIIVPLCSSATFLIAWITSALIKESPKSLITENQDISIPYKKLLASRRKRAKKNIFEDSLRPKNGYRWYALGMIIFELLIANEGDHLGLTGSDYWFLWGSVMILSFIVAMPWLVESTHRKTYVCTVAFLLAVALPFCSAAIVFSHPDNAQFAYFFLFTVIVLGAMVGWTILSMTSIMAVAGAAYYTLHLNQAVGIPDNWPTLCMLTLAIFTYYAMNAGKEALITEKNMSMMHTILEKINQKALYISLDLLQSKRSLNLQDTDRLVKISAELRMMLEALLGATNISPEEAHLEMSICETLEHVIKKFTHKFQASFEIHGNDFTILGDRDIFESVITHLLDNAAYYIDRDEATRVICTLNPHKKTLTIANDGPQINSNIRPYIFDLGYSHNKEGLGLGLAYCKKMLQGMHGNIRFVSRSRDHWVQFRLYFPRYQRLPECARIYPIRDNDHLAA